MKINPNRYYSLLETQKLAGIKSREYAARYIKEGILTAIEIGGVEKHGKRYAILGTWIQSFVERQKSGLVKGEQFTTAELKIMIKAVIDYCEKNNIKTLKELNNNLSKIK